MLNLLFRSTSILFNVNSYIFPSKLELIKILLDKIIVWDNWDLKIILKFFTDNKKKSKNNLDSSKKNDYEQWEKPLNEGKPFVVKKYNGILNSTI